MPSLSTLDTELSAVNTILGSIGQAPISSLNDNTFTNPEVDFIYKLLRESNLDIQSEGWSFNKESHVLMSIDENGKIPVASNVLDIDFSNEDSDRYSDVVIRSGYLYDRVNHTEVFTTDKYCDITYLLEFTSIPQVFRRYITYAASSKAAVQLVSNPQLVQLLATKEAHSRATCMEHECNQGDYSYFGLGHETNYRSYKPFQVLNR